MDVKFLFNPPYILFVRGILPEQVALTLGLSFQWECQVAQRSMQIAKQMPR